MQKARNSYQKGIDSSTDIIDFLDRLEDIKELDESIDELFQYKDSNFYAKVQTCFDFFSYINLILDLQQKAIKKRSEIDEILDNYS